METEYFEAVKRNDLEAVEQILSSPDPPDVNAVDDEGRSPLVVAIEFGYLGLLASNLPFKQ